VDRLTPGRVGGAALQPPKALHARLDRRFNVEELTAGLDNETYLVTTLEEIDSAERGCAAQPAVTAR
jgi:hypothetical protein